MTIVVSDVVDESVVVKGVLVPIGVFAVAVPCSDPRGVGSEEVGSEIVAVDDDVCDASRNSCVYESDVTAVEPVLGYAGVVPVSLRALFGNAGP